MKKFIFILLMLKCSLVLSSEETLTSDVVKTDHPSVAVEDFLKQEFAKYDASRKAHDHKLNEEMKKHLQDIPGLPELVSSHSHTQPVTYEQWKKNSQELINSARVHDMENLKKLLAEENLYIDFKDPVEGATALIESSLKGYPKVVEILLMHGSNVDMQDNNGKTALMHAPSSTIAKMLLEKGANVNIKDKSGSTALIDAASNGHTEIVRLLLAKGANVNDKDYTGRTALAEALLMGHAQIAELLRKHGATE